MFPNTGIVRRMQVELRVAVGHKLQRILFARPRPANGEGSGEREDWMRVLGVTQECENILRGLRRDPKSRWSISCIGWVGIAGKGYPHDRQSLLPSVSPFETMNIRDWSAERKLFCWSVIAIEPGLPTNPIKPDDVVTEQGIARDGWPVLASLPFDGEVVNMEGVARSNANYEGGMVLEVEKVGGHPVRRRSLEILKAAQGWGPGGLELAKKIMAAPGGIRVSAVGWHGFEMVGAVFDPDHLLGEDAATISGLVNCQPRDMIFVGAWTAIGQ